MKSNLGSVNILDPVKFALDELFQVVGRRQFTASNVQFREEEIVADT